MKTFLFILLLIVSIVKYKQSLLYFQNALKLGMKKTNLPNTLKLAAMTTAFDLIKIIPTNYSLDIHNVWVFKFGNWEKDY
jgi:hypothetical protein